MSYRKYAEHGDAQFVLPDVLESLPSQPTANRLKLSDCLQSFRTDWRSLGLTINRVAEYFAMDDGLYAVANLEIIAGGRAPLPITETGYKSHFTSREVIEAEGGPVTYAIAWLEYEAAKPAWKAREAVARQLLLF